MLTTAHATEGATTLYEHAPWAVLRFDNPSGSMCLAGVATPEKTFSVFATKNGSAINVSMPAWRFTEHKGSMMLKVDDSGMGALNAIYSGNAGRIVGPKELIYVIMRGLDVPGSGDLEVLGEDNKVIATFDITGVGAALKVWKDCADGLPAAQ